MVDVASIIVAVIAGVLALVSTGLQTFYIWFSDERKRLTEAEKLVARYRDPILLASQDLQARLYNIVDLHPSVTVFLGTDDEDDLLLYTAFLVGQYLSWTHILRIQAQFLRFSTDKQNMDLTKVLTGISQGFSTSEYNRDGLSGPFMLYRSIQMAIGERMTVKEKDGSEPFCMGYADFHQEFVRDYRAVTMGGSGKITGLTHQSERPEKCPILNCEHNQKGFARKYDLDRQIGRAHV